MKDWENIYKSEGDVISRKAGAVHPLVEANVALLKRERVLRVLDLGCGPGRHSIFLAERGFSVTAVDNAPTALEMLERGKGSSRLAPRSLTWRACPSLTRPLMLSCAST
jgi:2-polyprenyl-3-methyl-5-hydroxy-6-metoxy-1,4-benzoquinol methylase